MAVTITEAFAVTETVSTTEWSFVTDSAGPDVETSDGDFRAQFDVSALAAGDEFRFRVYEKVQSGGTQRVIHEATLLGAQATPIYEPDITFRLMHGWDMTWLKVAGTDRSILGSIRNIGESVAADVTAIKAKTDSLTFTQAGHVDANVQRINDVTIVGNGSGVPFQV